MDTFSSKQSKVVQDAEKQGEQFQKKIADSNMAVANFHFHNLEVSLNTFHIQVDSNYNAVGYLNNNQGISNNGDHGTITGNKVNSIFVYRPIKSPISIFSNKSNVAN